MTSVLSNFHAHTAKFLKDIGLFFPLGIQYLCTPPHLYTLKHFKNTQLIISWLWYFLKGLLSFLFCVFVLISRVTGIWIHRIMSLANVYIFLFLNRFSCVYSLHVWIFQLSITGLSLQVLRFMAFSATYNNISVISWLSILLVEETGVPGENHWPDASHWQKLLHNEQGSNSQL